MARPATITRRALQPLWSALDAHLAPHLGRGALLCVSGGVDSRALLEAVARWRGRFAGELAVACVDHGTRPEGAGEALAVVARAAALGLPGHALHAQASAAGEGALREARYRALAALARRLRLGVLVVAHQADDVAEGALLSWLGAGGGPGGASPPRASEREGLLVVRPFLELPRATLRAALLALGVDDWFEDPDARSARARLRARLASLSGEEDPRPALARAAVRRRDDEEVLASAAAGLLTERAGSLEVQGQAPPALVRRALEEAVRRGAGGDPRGAAAGVATALRLLAGGRPGRVDLVGARLEVTRSGVVRLLRLQGAPVTVAGSPGPTHAAGEPEGGDDLSGAASMPKVGMPTAGEPTVGEPTVGEPTVAEHRVKQVREEEAPGRPSEKRERDDKP